MKRLAIVTTHPIQYYAPIFKLLSERGEINIHVFYTWSQAENGINDPGFGKQLKWDIPLLEGYKHSFVANTANDPGSHHFKGIVNPTLIEQVHHWQADAILVIGWAYKSHFKVMRHFKNKIPVVFRGDSTLLDERFGVKQLLRNVYLKWVYRHIDFALYPGSNSKAYFLKYGLSNKQLVFAPHAIDNERFGNDHSQEALRLRAKLQIRQSDVLVLFAGKLEGKKSPGLLIDSFKQLYNDGVHLLLVGNGILEHTLKEKSKGIKNIHFMDFKNQSYMPGVYQACDLFCLPSEGPGETWGLAVNEAMACGKAILVSDKVGCAADLIKEGVNGSIFKHRDQQSLLEKLKDLTASKSALIQKGKQSREIIKEWNFSAVALAIEKLISSKA